MTTQLRYATHLGYRSLQAPLFLPQLNTLDPAKHIELAGRLGFHGVQMPQAMNMDAQSIGSAAAALAESGLEGACIICTPREMHSSPIWTRSGPDVRERLRATVEQACLLAGRLRSRTLTVVPRAVPGEGFEGQRDALLENISHVAGVVAAHGLSLGIEPMRILPDALLRSSADGAAVVKALNHAAVSMIFDTAHSWDMDDDVVAALDRYYDVVGLVQLADQPGRVEPGAGNVDMVGVLALLMRRGFTGLVGLEHEWSRPDAAGMEQGLESFWRVHAAATASATRQ